MFTLVRHILVPALSGKDQGFGLLLLTTLLSLEWLLAKHNLNFPTLAIYFTIHASCSEVIFH